MPKAQIAFAVHTTIEFALTAAFASASIRAAKHRHHTIPRVPRQKEKGLEGLRCLPGLSYTTIEFALTAAYASASLRTLTHADLPDASAR